MQLSTNFEIIGQLDSSLYYHKLFTETKGKISNTELQEKASNLIQQYDLDKLIENNQLEIDLISWIR